MRGRSTRHQRTAMSGFSSGVSFLAGVALAVLAAGLILWRSPSQIVEESGMRLDVSQPALVRQIQQLERIETVTYRMEKIITAERASRYLPQFLAGERLLLIVHGEVIAGIDLRKVGSEQVVVRGKAIELALPDAEVFLTRVDNERTRVYSRETGLFSRVDPQLETQVRQEGERQLLQAAMEDGILTTAEQNARSTLSRLLEGFGFSTVEFR